MREDGRRRVYLGTKMYFMIFKEVATVEKKSYFGLIGSLSEPASDGFVSSTPTQDSVPGSTRCCVVAAFFVLDTNRTIQGECFLSFNKHYFW